MSRKNRPILDATMFSTSAIGSPAAFSTAIKPPGNFSTNPSSADSSLLAHEPHNMTHVSDNVAGQLSLTIASEAPPTEGTISDDTSLGILDLDNIQENSMSVFLTSPRTTHNLVTTAQPSTSVHHHHPITTHTTPPQYDPSPPPSMGPLRISAATTSRLVTHETVVVPGDERKESEIGEVERGDMSLSEDLLEVTGEYKSSEDESEPEIQTTVTREGRPVDQMEHTASIQHDGHAPIVSIPDHVRQSGDGNEAVGTTMLVQRPPKSPSSHHQTTNPGRESSGGFSVAEILQAAENEGEQQLQNDLFLSTKHTSDSLITDQEEPSIMRQTAEFSHFEPNNLSSTIHQDDTTNVQNLNSVKKSSLTTAASSRSDQRPVSVPQQMSSPPFTMSNSGLNVHSHYNPLLHSSPTVERDANSAVTVAEGNVRVDSQLQDGERDSINETSEEHIITDLTSPEALSSQYFYPSSMHSSVSHTPSGTPRSSLPSSPYPPTHSQSSLASSLGALANDLGERLDGGSRRTSEDKQQYNPFSSQDSGGMPNVGEEEFGQCLNSESFIAHLDADEAVLQETNKLMLPEGFSAPSPHTPSFTNLSSSTPAISQSDGKEISIGTYFGQRSYKIGALQASDIIASNERPQFSSSSSGLIKSSSSLHPAETQHSTSLNLQTTPSSADQPADTTLLAENGSLSSVEKSPGKMFQVKHSHTSPQQNSGELARQFPSPLAALTSQAVQSEVTEVSLQTTLVNVPTTMISSTSILDSASLLANKPQEQHVSGAILPHTTAAVTRVSADNLTPVVTVHTPFPMQYAIPKLDLSGFSKTIDSTSTVRTSTALKFNPPALSAEFKQKHTAPEPVQTQGPPVIGIEASPTLTPSVHLPTTATSSSHSIPLSPSPDMEFVLEQSGVDSGLSSGLEQKLASQYWKPSSATSTLIFPEISATTLSPPPTDMEGLTNMPTPSLANLSGGFNATSLRDDNFLESLLEGLPSATAQLSSFEQTSKLTNTPKLSPSISTAVDTTLTPQVTVIQAQTSNSTEAAKLSMGSSVKSSPASVLSSELERSNVHTTVGTSQSTESTRKRTRTSSATSPIIPVDSTIPTTGNSPGRKTTPKKQRPLSPKTESAKKKLAELRATLDAQQHDAAAYISRLQEGKQITVDRQEPADFTAETVKLSSISLPTPGTLHEHYSKDGNKATGSVSLSAVGTQSLQAAPKSVTQSPPVAANMTVSHSVGTTTLVSQRTPVVHQSITTMAGQSPKLGEDDTRNLTATIASPLSSQQSASLVSTISLTPSVSQISTVSSSKKQTSPKKTSGKTEQPKDSGKAVIKSPKHDQMIAELQSQQILSHQSVRDIGVGTTPSLQQRAQARYSVHNTLPQNLHSKASPQVAEPSTTSSQRHSSSPNSQAFCSPSHTSNATKEQPSSSQPIYTSPRLLPHTFTFSPPPQPHSQPLTYKERRKTPESNALSVPDSLCFKSPCCVGVTLPEQLQITNIGDRWLQLSFELNQLYCNGTHCQDTESQTFSFPQRCFVSPRKTESIKVTFSPKQAGNYEAVLTCKAKLVVSSETDDSNFISENVILKALAVCPALKVAMSTNEDNVCLDYGVLVTGSSLSLPLHLSNHGTSELPLRLSIAAPTLAQLHFSFDDPPPALKAPPSSPSSYLHSRPFSTVIVLPPKPQGKSKQPEVFPINLNFKSPKSFTDDASPLGPPEEIKAQINISVEGPNSTGVLCSVPIRATVGVARLHVPSSLQALSISCTEKQIVTREVPFKNAGNIPLQITLKFSTSCDHFSVSPNLLDLKPSEEAQVKVSFSPPTSPLTINGYIMIRVQPDGPSYELKVQGTALKAEDHSSSNLLLCNKRLLYWGGVNVGDTVEQKLMLQNDFSTSVPLEFSIRHQNQAFQFHTDEPSMCWAYKATLPEHSQFQLNLLFTPQSASLFRNALDIYDTAHSKKFRIPLCGYGGCSAVEVINARQSSTMGLWLDLGPLSTQQQSTVKVSLYNSGSRAAFLKALCVSLGDGHKLSPLSPDHVTVTPSQCVLQPQQIQELNIEYRTSFSEEVAKCSEANTPLARLVLLHGDEIIRQRFHRAISTRKKSEDVESHLKKKFNEEFLNHFPEQEYVPSELDFSLFEVDDEEAFFEQHINQISVTLCMSSMMTETPIPKQTSSYNTPPKKTLHTLSPSHSMPCTTPPSHAHKTATPSRHVVSSHTLLLPDVTVGKHSENMLEVHNPYSQPLHWQLSSVASPFVRDSVDTSSNICKANYSVFWVHVRRGSVLPHSTAQVQVAFQPHDVGSFSQIWDLQVSCTDIENGSKKLRLSFGGKAALADVETTKQDATSSAVPRVHFASPPPATRAQPNSPTHHHQHHTVTTVTTSRPPPPSLTKRTIYIKEDKVEFPHTQVGSQSTLKVKVCNRDKFQHQFEVVSLSSPFSVEHRSFELGSRQCARLPVIFRPTQPGTFHAVLAVKTATGHQAFSQLTGLAILQQSM